jgi:DNA-binding LytR/AlgR family response regulator
MGKAVSPVGICFLPVTLYTAAPHVFIRCLDKDHHFELYDIFFLEAWKEYTRFFVKGKKDINIVASHTLKHYEREFAPFGLVRVSRKHIINPREISELIHGDKHALKLNQYPETLIPIGESYRKNIISVFTPHSGLPPKTVR